jgi:hypothetical protein
MHDLGSSLSATIPVDSRRRSRPIWLTVIVFVTGFLAVLFLGCGIIIWVSHAKVNVSLGIDQWGIKKTVWIHAFGLGAILFILGVWFTILTRGLWQGRRYGRVLGWMTLGAIAAIAILVTLT